MDEEKKSRKISDNPSPQEMKALLPALEMIGTAAGFLGKLGIKREAFQSFKAKVDEISKQAEIIDLPDRFNQAFGKNGWIAVGSALSVDVIKSALELHDAGEFAKAENTIVDWFTKENIELFAILRARRFHDAKLRDDQLKEALNLFLEERYMAAVPLILIACDGFASDVSATSPFEKDADLSCFDSITGHHTSLPALMKLVTKGVYKSRDDEIDIPLRHGILHGRSLGYANKVVCAKAWLLMMALVDWAIDMSSENERREEFDRNNNTTWSDVLEQSRKTQANKHEIEAFEPYEKSGPFNELIDVGRPEGVVWAFMAGWKSKNYGKMAQNAVNLTGKSVKKMAGEMRNMAEFVELEDFEIKTIRFSTVARCDVRVWAKAKTLRKEVEGEFDLFMIRYTAKGDVAMPHDEDCIWAVQQNCIYNVMNEKFAE